MKRLVLVDGHNLLFKMFYGIPASIKNSKGVEIRGVIGFIGALKKLNTNLNPTSLVVIFDSETSRNNNALLLDDYKGNRPDYNDIPADENPFTGLPIIKKSLEFLNIPFYEVIDNEADDYIASLTKEYNDSFDELIVVSNDSDFFQLIDDKTFIYSPRGKLSTLYNKETFEEKYHIKPSQYIMYKSLIGDTADNIKGIKGIGKKTAEEILKYGILEEYLIKSPNERIKRMLKDQEEIIKRNIKLISLNHHIDTKEISLNVLDDKINTYKVYEILTEIDER